MDASAWIAGYGMLAISMSVIGVRVSRSLATKEDCKENLATMDMKLERCKGEVDRDLDRGRDDFRQIRDTQSEQGEQIASIGATVNVMAVNVDRLVNHALGEK